MPKQTDITQHPIVSPNSYDWLLQFERPANIQACAYWRERCQGHRMPSRSDLAPGAMRQFSAHVGLVEIRSDQGTLDYFIRRAGSRWEEVYGSITGRLLGEFLPPHIESAWREAFGAVHEAASPVRLTAQVDFENKTWLAIEMLIAPLGETT